MCHLHIINCKLKFPFYAILVLLDPLFARFFNDEVYICVGVITPTWQSKRHKRGNRVYLAEYKSIRQGKKVISKFVRYIGPEDKVSTSEKTRKRVLDRLNLSSSYRASGSECTFWTTGGSQMYCSVNPLLGWEGRGEKREGGASNEKII